MRKVLLTLILLMNANAFATGTVIEKTSTKHPYNLLTLGYGIVSEDDLAYDNFRRNIGPYDPENSLGALYWQCVPVENVKAGFGAWVGTDGMDAYDKIKTMCMLDISIEIGNETQTFTDRRAHPIDFCLDFTKEWKRLTKNQKYVCLDGEGGAYYDEDKNTGRQKLWTWDKFKTKIGCYSFFDGDCNTSGCDRDKGICKIK
jgi:hypothetical protein